MTFRKQPMIWVEQIDLTGYQLSIEPPGDAIDDCSASGDVTESVKFWVNRLRFDAPSEGTKQYLKATGAWDDDELNDHTTNVERLFWLIAGDLKEKYLGD